MTFILFTSSDNNLAREREPIYRRAIEVTDRLYCTPVEQDFLRESRRASSCNPLKTFYAEGLASIERKLRKRKQAGDSESVKVRKVVVGGQVSVRSVRRADRRLDGFDVVKLGCCF
jgi:hypothetical protein